MVLAIFDFIYVPFIYRTVTQYTMRSLKLRASPVREEMIMGAMSRPPTVCLLDIT